MADRDEVGRLLSWFVTFHCESILCGRLYVEVVAVSPQDFKVSAKGSSCPTFMLIPTFQLSVSPPHRQHTLGFPTEAFYKSGFSSYFRDFLGSHKTPEG